MDWLDLLAVQGTLKSLLQHHRSKASVLWHSASFIVQLSHPYISTGKTIALTRWTLGCFYLSAIMSNVAMNMSGQTALEILLSILLGTYPEVELLDHMVILFLIFWGTALLFSTAAAPFYTPTRNIEVFQFFHFLTNTCHFLFFFFLIISILLTVRWYLILVLVWITLMISIIEHLFICLLGIYVSFWKKISSSPLPIFELNFFVVVVSLHELSFFSVKSILWCTKVFNFDIIYFICFFFCCLCSWYHILQLPFTHMHLYPSTICL